MGRYASTGLVPVEATINKLSNWDGRYASTGLVPVDRRWTGYSSCSARKTFQQEFVRNLPKPS